jgi:predicted aconitase with swiveling domain
LPGHLEGISIKGGILILEGSRAFNGWSIFFHAAQVVGFGPLAPVFPHLDSRSAVTAAVRNISMVTDLVDDPFAVISEGDRVRVDGDDGTVKVIQGLRS